MAIIYGVDTDKEVTPLLVRDAIVECFIQAHKDELADFDQYSKDMAEEEVEAAKKVDVRELTRSFFTETGGNFEEPTKQSLVNIIDKLANFSKNFRDQETINKHYQEISLLIGKLI